jgi:TPR repeat protein
MPDDEIIPPRGRIENVGGVARGEDYAPANAAAALQQLPGWRCSLNLGCPISRGAYAALTAVLAGDREAQYKLARLQRGDGIPRDVRGRPAWYGKAAEQGHVTAALELNRVRHEGADIPADETKIAAALRFEIDKGDRDAMHALADLQVTSGCFAVLTDSGAMDCEADIVRQKD